MQDTVRLISATGQTAKSSEQILLAVGGHCLTSVCDSGTLAPSLRLYIKK